MKYLNRFITIIFSLFIHASACASTEHAFYILHTNPKHIEALNQDLTIVKQHHQSIQLLISQAYKVDENGLLTGYLNQELIHLAHAHAIKLMAMVTNAGFDKIKVHYFLTSPQAQQTALNTILAICRQYHLYGIQFDFESVSVKDKQALTQFYQHAAEQLHQAGFRISYAVIPAFTDHLSHSVFLKRTYQNWSGAYDLKSLGKSADFVTLMAYNQHPDGTIPGPNASIKFTEAAIKNALKEIPANKLSLGIPAYSLYWYSGHTTVAARQAEISYLDAQRLIKKNHASIIWNQTDKINYAIYDRDWLNEYIYLEDVNSFKAKLALAKKFKLRGISVFRIGTEDNRIWSFLKEFNRNTHAA